MDNKFILIFLFLVIGIVRFTNHTDRKKYKFLYVSLAVQLISIGSGLKLYSFTLDESLIGAFGDSIRIELATVFSFFLIFQGFGRFDKIEIGNKLLFVFIVLLIFISFFNPSNVFKLAILSPISYFFQIWILFHIIKSNFNIIDIFKGIYDAFLVLTIVQLILTICYPVLGITFIGELFIDSLSSSLKREGVISALGTYGHPSSLAMVCLVYAVFFMTSFLNKYRKNVSLVLVFVNLFVVYLTFSRTTYLISFFIFIIVYNLQKGQLFKIKNLLSLIFGLLVLLLVLNFTDLGNMFFKSDSQHQIYNRLTHWMLGLELWQNSKLIGLGINTHVYYMENNLLSSSIDQIDELIFFLSNPIHNIHLIVLVETGIIGMIVWLYFFINKLKQNFRQTYLKIIPIRVLSISSFSVLLIVFTYGFMGWGVFLKETSVIFFLLIYFSFDYLKIYSKSFGRRQRII